MTKIGIKDIAKKCNVSIATVSYVINGVDKVSEDKKKLVLKTIEELNYNPNLNARALSKGESKLIGILLPLVEKQDSIGNLIGGNPFYMEFIEGAESEIKDCGYDILISGTYNQSGFKKWLSSRTLDGLVLFGSSSKEIYKTIKEMKIPCCIVDGEEVDGFISVNIDDKLGGYLATKHLIEYGHRKIGFFGSSLDKSNVNRNRYEGYVKALRNSGISLNSNYIFEDEVSYEAGVRMAEKFVKDKLDITSLVCTSDITAIGLIKGLTDLNVKVPEELSVVGFDDIKMSSYITPTLTTVKQDVVLKGKIAIEYLISTIKGKINSNRQTILIPSLIVRKSTKHI